MNLGNKGPWDREREKRKHGRRYLERWTEKGLERWRYEGTDREIDKRVVTGTVIGTD